jgi:hypothetical protein
MCLGDQEVSKIKYYLIQDIKIKLALFLYPTSGGSCVIRR